MIRFLADADLNEAIVFGCRRRERGIDFLSANEANLEGMPDPEVLALAAQQDRILVSHDFKTMPQHFAAFLEAQGSSPGVFLVKQYEAVHDVIDEIVHLWASAEANQWMNCILRVPRK